MQDLSSLLAFHNPWWLTGKVPEALSLPFRRPVFNQLLDYLPLERVIILKGPRRTGKSTLLFQLLQALLERGVAAQRLLYLPFDDPDLTHDFADVLLQFEKQLGREIREEPEVYCFFDEIQQWENWSRHLKKYLDKKWPIRFIVSGSSASLIKSESESLAGRTIEETILPFSFFEFALFHLEEAERALLQELRAAFEIFQPALPSRAGLIENKLSILFEQYLKLGGFPNLFVLPEPRLRKKLLQEDVIEKVIYRDLVKRYGVKKPDTLEKLFLYLVNQSSDILNVASISNSLKLSREATQEYLEYLRESYLVMLTPRFAFSAETAIRANPKAYAMDCGFFEAFSSLPIGKRVESLVARHLFFLQPGYYHNREEVDFVIAKGNSRSAAILPLEVKYREQIGNEDMAGLSALRAKKPFEKAIMVTKNFKGEQNNVVFIPAHLFLALV